MIPSLTFDAPSSTPPPSGRLSMLLSQVKSSNIAIRLKAASLLPSLVLREPMLSDESPTDGQDVARSSSSVASVVVDALVDMLEEENCDLRNASMTSLTQITQSRPDLVFPIASVFGQLLQSPPENEEERKTLSSSLSCLLRLDFGQAVRSLIGLVCDCLADSPGMEKLPKVVLRYVQRALLAKLRREKRKVKKPKKTVDGSLGTVPLEEPISLTLRDLVPRLLQTLRLKGITLSSFQHILTVLKLIVPEEELSSVCLATLTEILSEARKSTAVPEEEEGESNSASFEVLVRMVVAMCRSLMSCFRRHRLEDFLENVTFFLAKQVVPTCRDSNLLVDVVRCLASLSQVILGHVARQVVTELHAALLEHLCLPEEGQPSSPVNFSVVEGLLLSFSCAAAKSPQMLFPLCGISVYTGQPGETLPTEHDRASRARRFLLNSRLMYAISKAGESRQQALTNLLAAPRETDKNPRLTQERIRARFVIENVIQISEDLLRNPPTFQTPQFSWSRKVAPLRALRKRQRSEVESDPNPKRRRIAANLSTSSDLISSRV